MHIIMGWEEGWHFCNFYLKFFKIFSEDLAFSYFWEETALIDWLNMSISRELVSQKSLMSSGLA